MEAKIISAKGFLKEFENDMKPKDIKTFKAFIDLEKQNFFERKATMLRHKFLPSSPEKAAALMTLY